MWESGLRTGTCFPGRQGGGGEASSPSPWRGLQNIREWTLAPGVDFPHGSGPERRHRLQGRKTQELAGSHVWGQGCREVDSTKGGHVQRPPRPPGHQRPPSDSLCKAPEPRAQAHTAASSPRLPPSERSPVRDRPSPSQSRAESGIPAAPSDSVLGIAPGAAALSRCRRRMPRVGRHAPPAGARAARRAGAV
uniref:uncharacterized protein LOC114674604 isoform X2 n=1 Tax=Macaca mulatta TaxID=9544 RepID=UPI0010A21CCB|nr:uncharacterized protein LOC114674604 isoform X2 [Macaca mulatta]